MGTDLQFRIAQLQRKKSLTGLTEQDATTLEKLLKLQRKLHARYKSLNNNNRVWKSRYNDGSKISGKNRAPDLRRQIDVSWHKRDRADCEWYASHRRYIDRCRKTENPDQHEPNIPTVKSAVHVDTNKAYVDDDPKSAVDLYASDEEFSESYSSESED